MMGIVLLFGMSPLVFIWLILELTGDDGYGEHLEDIPI